MAYKLWLSLKTQFRVPISIFFTLLFPLVMMVAMLLSYGNFSIGNGLHFIDKYFLISSSIGLLPLTLISFPTFLTELIEKKTTKRLYYFGVNIRTMLVADVISYFIIASLSLAVNILVARLVYRLHLPDMSHFIAFLAQVFYAIIPLLLIGACLGLLIHNSRIVLPVGMLLMFITYMLIGIFTPFKDLPEGLKNMGQFLPIKYVANDFFDIWQGKTFFVSQFLQLNSIWLLIGLVGLIILLKAKKGQL
ncbi:MAG: ABC transporter permease [Streptococcaceae bacterium]|jgi:ABC-2 type transport system permease protein|nr:ABC transporter permease [Streptococcaceae bacterium]